jgi:hypothetical protein
VSVSAGVNEMNPIWGAALSQGKSLHAASKEPMTNTEKTRDFMRACLFLVPIEQM